VQLVFELSIRPEAALVFAVNAGVSADRAAPPAPDEEQLPTESPVKIPRF